MVVTYAHTQKNTQLPRLINGTPRRHLALSIGDGDFDVQTFVADERDIDLYAPMDTCDACPPFGAPALACDVHGYIFSREQYDGVDGWSSYDRDQDPWYNRDTYCCDACSGIYGYVPYSDYYDYADDNYDYYADSLDEEATAEQEVADFVDAYLRDETPTNPETWQKENARHHTAKQKRTFRGAISRSATHRRRDGSVKVRGHHGFGSRRYEAGVTPRRDYLTKKEAEF
jgi:hypothetical protein